MKPFNYEKAREFLKQKENNRKALIKKRFIQATHDFDVITNEVASRYNPSKIYQWGSLLNERHFSEISDIDIALDWMISSSFFKSFGTSTMFTPEEVTFYVLCYNVHSTINKVRRVS